MEGKELGLVSLLSFFSSNTVFFSENHVHSIDASQRQRSNKFMQETGLQLPVISIRNVFSYSILSKEGKWYLKEYFWLFH